MSARMMRCGRTKRGWYCKRRQHLTGPCALVPRWWNLKGRWAMSLRCGWRF